MREEWIKNKTELKLDLAVGEKIRWEHLLDYGSKFSMIVTDSVEAPDGKTYQDSSDPFKDATVDESGNLSFSKAGVYYMYYYLFNYKDETLESAPFMSIKVTVQ